MSVTISVIVTSEQELIYICSGMHEIDCLSSVDVVSSLSGKACNNSFFQIGIYYQLAVCTSHF